MQIKIKQNAAFLATNDMNIYNKILIRESVKANIFARR